MLICAEDDDLALVGVVHLGRTLGLDLEVLPGAEHEDPRWAAAIERRTHSLFAIVRSTNLSPRRTLTLESMFAGAHIAGADVVSLELTRDPHSTLQPVLDRLCRDDGWMPGVSDEAPSETLAPPFEPARPRREAVEAAAQPVVSPSFAADSAEPNSRTGPLAPVPQLGAFDHPATHAGADELTAPFLHTQLDDPWEGEPLEVPRRFHPVRWVVAAFAVAALGGGAYVLFGNGAPPNSASEPEVQVVEAASVPLDIDEQPP